MYLHDTLPCECGKSALLTSLDINLRDKCYDVLYTCKCGTVQIHKLPIKKSERKIIQ